MRTRSRARSTSRRRRRCGRSFSRPAPASRGPPRSRRSSRPWGSSTFRSPSTRPRSPPRPELARGQVMITYRGTVYPWHCDHMGHMNVMWYVSKFDEATWQLFSHLGLTNSRLQNDGTGMAAVEQNLQYKRELHAGDVITIRSAVLGVKDKSIRLTHEMSNDETEEIAAITVIIGVHLDTNTRRARPLPADIR